MSKGKGCAKSRTVNSIKTEITSLMVDNEFQKYEKKLDGHCKHWLCHSYLVKFGTMYLCALAKNIAMLAVSADDRLEDILLICNIIDNRRDEPDRSYAIEYISRTCASLHPYGREIIDRIKDVTAFTDLNI